MAFLLASDFDGTLCQGGVIAEQDRLAIRRFREEGNRFVIVTGRTYHNALRGFRDADFHDMDGFLCLSGAYAADAEGHELYDKRMSAARLPELVDFFTETGARYINIDIGQSSYQLDLPHEADFGLEWFPADKIGDIVTLTSLNVGYPTEKRAYEISSLLRERFGEMLTPLQNLIAIDMPPAGVNKAVGASYAAKLFGILDGDIYSSGDSYNDIDMLRAFHGYAMASAPDEGKAVSEGVVSHVSEIIERILK